MMADKYIVVPTGNGFGIVYKANNWTHKKPAYIGEVAGIQKKEHADDECKRLNDAYAIYTAKHEAHAKRLQALREQARLARTIIQ